MKSLMSELEKDKLYRLYIDDVKGWNGVEFILLEKDVSSYNVKITNTSSKEIKVNDIQTVHLASYIDKDGVVEVIGDKNSHPEEFI